MNDQEERDVWPWRVGMFPDESEMVQVTARTLGSFAQTFVALARYEGEDWVLTELPARPSFRCCEVIAWSPIMWHPGTPPTDTIPFAIDSRVWAGIRTGKVLTYERVYERPHNGFYTCSTDTLHCALDRDAEASFSVRPDRSRHKRAARQAHRIKSV